MLFQPLVGSGIQSWTMEKTLTKPVNRARTTFSPGIELTPMQRAFVLGIVRNGGKPSQAARLAGYSDPDTSGYDLSRLPHIQAAIKIERNKYLSNELANCASATLHEIMLDREAAPAARVQAARTVLEITGDIGKGRVAGGDEDRPLSELTADELTRMIDKWQDEKAALARPLDPADVEIVDKAQNRAQLQPEPAPGLP
jgi:hypothetical protein